MLVLARKVNESIMIGDDVELIVIDIKGDQVKLGIKAPKKVTVHRKEIYDEIQQENIAAVSSEFKPEALRELSDFFEREKKERDGNDTKGRKA
ncbi:MAG TPA: carbon storage regulator CsrA [Spirochaetota bacterium]|nr:carbon storage regulator CsrA [Spirochaetota bacterium]HNT11386.1 carbon storage regulator CsrA [Spirochaetota bacterium]HNV46827.1 carbon storage regulator CsrA [Spirochaetota bacterium]HOS40783.1 carbon storage regulator CsrA [Spirochaetota bacterium]HPI22701.1 carbon storage regulator CsrA [Spirochaetota bacterium]